MKTVNLLEFLNNAKDLYALSFAKSEDLVNFLDLMTEDEQFTRKIDLGIMFINQKNFDQYIVVDGLNRLLSLSLLLHAVCECYKKTTKQNDKAIQTIRKKYLLNSFGTKLRLSANEAIIYTKIINGDRLSGHEKQSKMFVLLHKFWTQIKEENLQAANIFRMLKKINVSIVETEGIKNRDLYYKLNINSNINQLALIEDYLKENCLEKYWEQLKVKFQANDDDIKLFLKDFFITKFNYKKFDNSRLYESFVNYFETMMQYLPVDTIMKKIYRSAVLYNDILNVHFRSEEIKQAFINVKKAQGEDTYAYILEVYEDLIDGNLSEQTFIEILNTICDYLKKRNKTDNKVAFNELIKYLNAFITCK